MRPFPTAAMDANADAESASQTFLQAMVDVLAERLHDKGDLQGAWDAVAAMPQPAAPEVIALQWQSVRAMLVGAVLAAEGFSSEGPSDASQTYNDAAANRDLEALRHALIAVTLRSDGRAEAAIEARFRLIGGRLLRSRRISSYLDMQPPNDGADLVSSWLSGALLLASRLRRPDRQA